MFDQEQYAKRIRQEAQHWGEVRPDAGNPQIWHDPALFDLFFGDEYRLLIERGVANGSHCLELGCGEGGLSLTLAGRGCKVDGLDLSPKRIERAQACARESGLESSTSFSVADLNTVDLPAERYSCIIAHDSLHHVLDLEHLGREIKKALKPGGTLLVMDYCGMGPLRKTLAAVLYAVLPTYKPYREKWQLRKRLPGFLAGEHARRRALDESNDNRIHAESPFEEISQASLLKHLRSSFRIIRFRSSLPFWFYLAPKIRLPHFMQSPAARAFRLFDNILSFMGVPGAYFSLEARNL